VIYRHECAGIFVPFDDQSTDYNVRTGARIAKSAKDPRQGIFSALYKHVESLAMSDPGVGGIRLYVDRSNDRAQQAYHSLAMRDAGYLVMESLFPLEEDAANA